jgi:metal-responsive CopG/Arc/MetJ family transcriptional regulator
MRVTKKRISISLHPIELAKLDRIADKYRETRSGMFTRLIQEFPEGEHGDTHDLGELTELAYYAPKKRKKSPKEYEDLEEVGDLSSK